ncbi:MAG: UDP-forming cellulose synthase catalytic subunit [Terracidiphilus sp.]|nr:UDP-forming cellulose synthase catalytic subunit [Terracidiphilus sp.]
MDTCPEKPDAMNRIYRTLMICATAFLMLQLISLYLNWPEQLVLGCVSVLLAVVANKISPSRVVTIALMILSATATLRYGWWRINTLIDYLTNESNDRFRLDSVFMLILVGAELYTIIIMFLGYIQTVWPLHRKPIPLPPDVSAWPHVDVLIPTYNESLALVRYTALAAINIDYPPEKLHVYILDDGSRKEFEEFSREAGVGYITRVEHGHAKAGNINHALTTMDSPFVAIFDCDHVPTRSFLQMTLGWMMADPLLAMLQTPHHFYSPDPFERNLLQYKTIPNESELFYGIVQDGNDLWNATFFCGSCALIRRSALDEVGGIAVETVTEDAHTSLRMQKLGYNTAYINIPQAAGLSTETLAAHVGQRIRWARGMIQILRTDNPLLGGKMKLMQRLCYLNAMAHFLYAAPRLIFLCAPLVYLLLGRTIIPGYWVTILVYALPHLILSNLTNSRVQSRFRHSFWNEIYESVLAPFIFAPTLLALINPKLGKFNVTDKGVTLAETRFDRSISTPTRRLLLLNVIALAVAPYRLYVTDPHHPGAVIMNVMWVLFNMMILGVAAAVAYEQKQRRESVRIEARIPVRVDLPDGRQIGGMTIDMSVGGASVKLSQDAGFAMGDSFRLAFPEQAGNAEIGAKVVGMHAGELRLSFALPTIAEQETLTRALYSRADAWISSLESKEADRPLVSLGRVMVLANFGIYQIIRSWFPEKKSTAKAALPASTAAAMLLMLVLGACSQAFAAGQLPGHALPGVAAAGHQNYTSAAPSAISPVLGAVLLDEEGSIAPQVLSLKDMGLTRPIEMKGPHSYYSLRFVLTYAMLPKRAALKLNYSIDPNLDPRTTSLGIILNGINIVSLAPPAATEVHGGFATVLVPIPDTVLVRSNVLTFEFTGSGVMQQEEQAMAHVMVRINPASMLEVDGDRLPWENNLSHLPLPIFDTDLQSTTVVRVAFLSPPSPKMLQSAGIVASWLGLSASTKPVRFAVYVGQIPTGNAIVFSADPVLLPGSLKLPVGSGPTVALRSNPSDTNGSVLVLAGEDEDQLLTVARTLSLTRSATASTPAEGLPLSGDTEHIPDLVMPAARGRNDAPRWLGTGRAIPLASCRVQDNLQTDGSSPIPVYFHVPPDLHYGEKQNLTMRVHYRYNALPVAKGSALRVVVNGVLVNEIPLLPGNGPTEGQRAVLVPVTVLRPFGNTVLFSFDFIPVNRQASQNPDAPQLKGEIFCNSTLDLQGLGLWARMPNLQLFANAGFPFTQLADLAETTVVLPAAPTAAEMGLYLHLMSHFGVQTGYPALRVSVSGPNTVISAARDYLILGTLTNQPAFGSLGASLPVVADPYSIHIKPLQGLAAYADSIKDAISQRWPGQLPLLDNFMNKSRPYDVAGVPDALVEEIQSPASPDRSIVLVQLKNDAAADTFAEIFLDRSQTDDITGTVSLLHNSKFESYAMDGPTYHMGNLSWYAQMRIWLGRHFLLLLLLVSALTFLLAWWIWGYLARCVRERLKLAEIYEKPPEDSEEK